MNLHRDNVVAFEEQGFINEVPVVLLLVVVLVAHALQRQRQMVNQAPGGTGIPLLDLFGTA